ncbi:MAG: hypothetical protein P1P72_05980 [ANME-2 cluster archaeon]|nr:hypothetical protein [ANME-2 cluster archaeon]
METGDDIERDLKGTVGEGRDYFEYLNNDDLIVIMVDIFGK